MYTMNTLEAVVTFSDKCGWSNFMCFFGLCNLMSKINRACRAYYVDDLFPYVRFTIQLLGMWSNFLEIASFGSIEYRIAHNIAYIIIQNYHNSPCEHVT